MQQSFVGYFQRSGSGSQISKIEHHQQQGCGESTSHYKESDIGLAVSCLARGTYAQADSAYDGKRTQESDETKYLGIAKCRVKEFCVAGVAAMSALSGEPSKDDDADYDDGRDDEEEYKNRYRDQQGAYRLSPGNDVFVLDGIAEVFNHDIPPGLFMQIFRLHDLHKTCPPCILQRWNTKTQPTKVGGRCDSQKSIRLKIDLILLQDIQHQSLPWPAGCPDLADGFIGEDRVFLADHDAVQKDHGGCAHIYLTVHQYLFISQALQDGGEGFVVADRGLVENYRDIHKQHVLATDDDVLFSHGIRYMWWGQVDDGFIALRCQSFQRFGGRLA